MIQAERKWSVWGAISFIPRYVVPIFLVVLTVYFGRAFGLAIYQSYFRMPDSVQVPDVAGKDVQEAQGILKNLGLDLEIQETRFKPSVKKNHIISQDPPSGSGRSVRKGRKVAVVVSLGAELVAVPKVIDMGVRDAKIALENAKLNTGKVTRTERKKGDPEVILEQNPAAGKMVKQGTKVNLVANIGDVAKIKVPEFQGQTLEKVRESVTWSDLHMGTVQWVVHPSIPPGTIIKQDPAPNASAKPGAEVDFKVSAGPDATKNELRQRTVIVRAPDIAGPQEIRIAVSDDTGTYDVYEGVHYAGETATVVVTAMNGGEYQVFVNDKLSQRKKL